jgi:hypothetical protein
VLRPGLLRYGDALAIRLSGEAIQSLTFTGPILSQPTKAWLLEGHGLTLKEGFAATITEYLICAFVTAAMSISGLLYLIVHFAPPRAVTAFAIWDRLPVRHIPHRVRRGNRVLVLSDWDDHRRSDQNRCAPRAAAAGHDLDQSDGGPAAGYLARLSRTLRHHRDP